MGSQDLMGTGDTPARAKGAMVTGDTPAEPRPVFTSAATAFRAGLAAARQSRHWLADGRPLARLASDPDSGSVPGLHSVTPDVGSERHPLHSASGPGQPRDRRRRPGAPDWIGKLFHSAFCNLTSAFNHSPGSVSMRGSLARPRILTPPRRLDPDSADGDPLHSASFRSACRLGQSGLGPADLAHSSSPDDSPGCAPLHCAPLRRLSNCRDRGDGLRASRLSD